MRALAVPELRFERRVIVSAGDEAARRRDLAIERMVVEQARLDVGDHLDARIGEGARQRLRIGEFRRGSR